MLEQLKQQDPTKPSDSQEMLNSQMQMSMIESNNSMSASMSSLENSYKQSAFSNATGIIGRMVETGDVGEDGTPASYQVVAIEAQNGEIYAKAYEATGYEDDGQTIKFSTTPTIIHYDRITKIF